jgi:transposase InsO family protein
MHKLAATNPRFGYRRVAALLRGEGWGVNIKRVHRLWKEAGLQVPTKKRKRRRLGTEANGCVRLKAAYPGHVWSYDFLYDRTEDGRQLKLMPVVDEYTRQCHAILVSRSITAEDVTQELERLFALHGSPSHLRSDNGPELVARAVREYLKSQAVDTRYIEPGAPWQNAYVESFNSKLRDELLDRELFTTTLEAQVLGEQYRNYYNTERPHSALDYQPPAAFAAGHIDNPNLEPALILT